MRKILAAAAALGVAATTGRAREADARPGADPPPPPPDAATHDATADGSEDGALDSATEDAAQDAPVYYYDARPGMDPAPPPPDANGPDGHMNPGFDPIGPSGQNAGCSCDVVGKPPRR